jgi:hypothetical protein
MANLWQEAKASKRMDGRSETQLSDNLQAYKTEESIVVARVGGGR